MISLTTEQNLRMQGMVDLCFVSHREMHEQDALALEQHNEGKEVCKYRVSVFATGRHFVLSAESDADMESWIEAFDRLLAYKYSAEELKAKAKAAKVRYSKRGHSAARQIVELKVTGREGESRKSDAERVSRHGLVCDCCI